MPAKVGKNMMSRRFSYTEQEKCALVDMSTQPSPVMLAVL
jgi:hypothetical protein